MPEQALWIVWVLPGTLAWLAVLLLPWRPWSTRERLEARDAAARLDDVTALIPARNEARTLPGVLRALAAQGEGLRAVVVDDQSSDGTAAAALSAWDGPIEVLSG